MNSGVFGDPCPNTHKYVEVHYACLPNGEGPANPGKISTRRPPPWLLEGALWNTDPDGGGLIDPDTGIPIEIDHEEEDKPRKRLPTLIESHPDEDLDTDDSSATKRRRKPILVATEVIEDDLGQKAESGQRIPITTPKLVPTTTTVKSPTTPNGGPVPNEAVESELNGPSSPSRDLEGKIWSETITYANRIK